MTKIIRCDICKKEIGYKERYASLTHFEVKFLPDKQMGWQPITEEVCENCWDKINQKIKELKNHDGL